ncbi:NADP-dependent oxidoreductase [Listeria ivanovii]|uniref:NADP-dependent oxidoreductase n=1 Tax=Listeria ivanovii TaxID=1638 RepID=UPI0019405947|nr:NADP-dependent oxidoreductase [Listeria ivanovii]MBM5606903.1 NADP-dependent oxidoreductase [Listeria ivanovii]MBM5635292.1 NADP-dependent oxidoreductase [Listeria ivanovii]MBM5705040.1 NADP-dependent oxidoreductase [Listeria ivanovii]
MKAAQISKYSKELHANITEIPIPPILDTQVLIKVKAAAVNPLEILNITGSVKLIQNYSMPFTLGNELTGIIEKVGDNVQGFKVGDAVYTRLPIEHIGAFAEYVAVDATAIWFLPSHLDFVTGAAVPLTGLTAYQSLHEKLNAKAGQTVFIAGGSGSFGQMAIPIAKSMGLNVIVSGNITAKERTLAVGADRFIDYKTENYWEVLEPVDFVIDTLGASEFERELAIIKSGGRLLSLITGPNKNFAISQGLPKWKQFLFGLAGSKYDKKAKEKNIEYYFIFVRADGKQLEQVSKIVEKNQIIPAINPTKFQLEDINQALELVANGHPEGKVIIRFDE